MIAVVMVMMMMVVVMVFIRSASALTIPLKPKMQKRKLWDPQRFALLGSKRKPINTRSGNIFKFVKAFLIVTYNDNNERFLHSKIDEIKNAVDSKKSVRNVWKVVNEINEKKKINKD